jgi:BirA family biotin operon repressor/biotin-[acetyl-CoA-carboxylase] ligase
LSECSFEQQIKQHMQLAENVRIHHFQSIDSTNQWLLENGQCGDVCIADQQTAGRGRRGKTWHSPDTGNIYLSVKHCFDEISPHFSLLSLVVGVAVAKALSSVGLQGHQLKWPNDIYWQDAKLGGILLESQKTGELVIGIGLNIVEDAVDVGQSKVGLQQVLNKPIDRSYLIANLLNHLVRDLTGFSRFNTTLFMQKWTEWDYLKNKTVNVHTNNEMLTGIANGIDQAGRLLLMVDGTVQAFSSAEVSVRTTL